MRLFVLAVVANLALDIPRPWDLALMVVPVLLFLVRPPRSEHAPVDLAPPVRGRWVALNSPGTSVPSHGVNAYGQAYAVDLLQPSPSAPTRTGWSPRTRRPESYPSFGAPVHAMAAGTVVEAADRQRDHRGRDTWPALVWMMTAEALVREVVGAPLILGNHVVVEHGDGTFAAYAHLRRGSVTVSVGDRVVAGQPIAAVGNTGNTSEPHLHVQVMDRRRLTAAAGIPMRWPELVVDPDVLDERWATGSPKPTALADFPANGQVFDAA
ncbi:M23 family metallopeptidase [Cellulomonas sp. Leaf334]|uniref:M23 family metallopeptidase n=1 Tax=Cellulomonas sp. Leaf334 TaxID=1736339 RepID=UPI0006FAF4E2|nr:M23 family metallopeptidase [Cellulomonas sp. Leaf334]KQR10383.1 hypothetical protein ASF78_16970 [Cellulomonas sp. Leaf334]